MGIKPICDWCEKEITQFGGLLFSPKMRGMRKKYHLCVNCQHNLSYCEKCVTEPCGALLFSAPNENNLVEDIPICIKCYNKNIAGIKDLQWRFG